MKRKNYLLPYSCQLVGWGLLGASVLFLLLVMVGPLSSLFPADWMNTERSRYLTLILMVLFYSGAFLVSLSREREEDEMIHELRSTSLTMTAYVMMAVFLIVSLICAFNAAFRFFPYSEVSALRLYSLQNITTNVLFGFFIYLAIYKTRLWKIRWEACRAMKEGE